MGPGDYLEDLGALAGQATAEVADTPGDGRGQAETSDEGGGRRHFRRSELLGADIWRRTLADLSREKGT
jgi:hypothetical protein